MLGLKLNHVSKGGYRSSAAETAFSVLGVKPVPFDYFEQHCKDIWHVLTKGVEYVENIFYGNQGMLTVI